MSLIQIDRETAQTLLNLTIRLEYFAEANRLRAALDAQQTANTAETPRVIALHRALPMSGPFGLADAYDAMRRLAETLEREGNQLRALDARQTPAQTDPKLAALLDSKWRAGDKPDEILGAWAEDFSTYHITVPPQLRDQLLALQHRAVDALAAPQPDTRESFEAWPLPPQPDPSTQSGASPVPYKRGCKLAGPGRGDCEHAIGTFDGQKHDEYGIPEGWCDYCWLASLARPSTGECEQPHQPDPREERDAGTVAVPMELLEECLEDMRDLRGEHDWHKDEPRCGHAAEYARLSERIARIETMLAGDGARGDGK